MKVIDIEDINAFYADKKSSEKMCIRCVYRDGD
ncbi:hypothetical protein ATF84_12414 [[Clostridium] innocuum]|nr:hypothetical protein ATF84_12414 [[Clostridium] innocuum]SSA49186.1 hypothetical protein SAMN04487929_12414 [[Clostridium] innocuum]